MKEPAKEEVQWDKKKIILFLVAAILLLGIGFEAKDLVLGKSVSVPKSTTSPDVKGAAVQAIPDIKNSVQNQLNALKTEAQGVNLVEIASSSPQVQKVINDLKALQDYPKNQVKATCQQICNNF
jgi:hypothetical protein